MSLSAIIAGRAKDPVTGKILFSLTWSGDLVDGGPGLGDDALHVGIAIKADGPDSLPLRLNRPATGEYFGHYLQWD